MSKFYFDKAIKEINPNAEFVLIGDNLDNIQWLAGTSPISKTDIETKSDEIATRDAYIIARQRAYPTIQEQLDMQYHDEVNGTTTWKDAIAKVKADNPKAE
tara:strand:+ start:642 stop:944 length:303 start_codon:yes stop_codon:yes gene_type:complete